MDRWQFKVYGSYNLVLGSIYSAFQSTASFLHDSANLRPSLRMCSDVPLRKTRGYCFRIFVEQVHICASGPGSGSLLLSNTTSQCAFPARDISGSALSDKVSKSTK